MTPGQVQNLGNALSGGSYGVFYRQFFCFLISIECSCHQNEPNVYKFLKMDCFDKHLKSNN